MANYACNMICYPHPANPVINGLRKPHHLQFMGTTFWANPMSLCSNGHHFHRPLAAASVEETAKTESKEGMPRFQLDAAEPEITEAQKEAIAQLPYHMAKRRKALMRQLICYSPQKGSLCELLAAWVRAMKPSGAHWLRFLKN